ncbi:MAG: hypothetical protein HZB50_13325 [Chloroflexi bacterium]|nr:hypothetical protein [Chloroflexota bacterium]
MQSTKKQLSQADLRSVQTFDLHSARIGLHDCPCPNHGTHECDCQMVILLVFGKTAEPVTLIMHGNGGQTWFSIADNSLQQADAKLIATIQHALEGEKSVPISNS